MNTIANAGNVQLTIKNAGLVLLNSYIPLLFERLGLTNDRNEFTDVDARMKAVQYLQVVAAGQSITEDNMLPLNKVLCGMLLTQPVPNEIEIREEEIILIEGLINAAIGHWSENGSSSVPSFRGNWLLRDGLLSETEARWELKVQGRAYDMLLNRSPFSYSIIKYPWMPKPLYVQWPS